MGIVTSRDIDFVHEPDQSRPIKEVRCFSDHDYSDLLLDAM